MVGKAWDILVARPTGGGVGLEETQMAQAPKLPLSTFAMSFSHLQNHLFKGPGLFTSKNVAPGWH